MFDSGKKCKFPFRLEIYTNSNVKTNICKPIFVQTGVMTVGEVTTGSCKLSPSVKSSAYVLVLLQLIVIYWYWRGLVPFLDQQNSYFSNVWFMGLHYMSYAQAS